MNSETSIDHAENTKPETDAEGAVAQKAFGTPLEQLARAYKLKLPSSGEKPGKRQKNRRCASKTGPAKAAA